MPVISLSNVDDPRLDVYRQLNKANLTRFAGRFVVEGVWLVERLLDSPYAVDSIVTVPRLLESLVARVDSKVPVYVLDEQQISQLVGFRFHRGQLACAHRCVNPTLSAILPDAKASATVVICSQVVDPTNLGGILRNCAAFGVDAVIVSRGCADPFSRRVVRVSMGNVIKLPVRQTDDLASEIAALQHAEYQCVATVLDENALALESATRSRQTALLFGGEAYGLDHELLSLCDQQVTLPMQHGTDSLNVATASGIFLYHFTHLARR